MKRTKDAASPSEAEDTSRRPNRRQALALGGAAAAAAAVAALGANGGKKAQAATGDEMILGQANTAGDTTGLGADVFGGALEVTNLGGPAAIAIQGVSNGGEHPGGLATAVMGRNLTDGPGVFGSSAGGAGVYGWGQGDGPGVSGGCDGAGAGVFGGGSSGQGVYGISTAGNGVEGQHLSNTEPGSAVYGLNMGVGPGVQGRADGEGASIHGWKPPFATGPGAAVEGQASGGNAGVHGSSQSGPGVEGESQGAEGVRGVTHAVPSGFGPWHGVLGVSLKPGVRTPSGPDDYGDAFGVFGHSGGGPGVNGLSEKGSGVSGSSNHSYGVRGHTYGAPSPENFPVGVAGLALIRLDEDPAVPAEDGPGTGVFGRSGSGTGVGAMSDSGYGVQGRSQSGIGAVGRSESNVGVAGVSPGESAAVLAESAIGIGPWEPDGGLALDVIGKARFSTAGAAVVPARTGSATVANPAVTPHSHITVTFTGDPGRAQVSWVERDAGNGFTVHLLGKSRSPIPFTYLIVEPGP